MSKKVANYSSIGHTKQPGLQGCGASPKRGTRGGAHDARYAHITMALFTLDALSRRLILLHLSRFGSPYLGPKRGLSDVIKGLLLCAPNSRGSS